MKKFDTIWSQFPVKNQVAYLVAYSSVFNDVITVDELSRRLSFNSENAVNDAIEELRKSGHVVVRKGFVALPYLDHKIDQKKRDQEITTLTVQKARRYLKWMGKLPFVKFIGISGSVAAGNPVQTKDKPLDIDVFVITSDSFTWLFGIVMATYRAIATKFKSSVFCFNHIWSETDLLVHNQNLFSAVEVLNLMPIAGERSYHLFLHTNRWIESYFPSLFKFNANQFENDKPIRVSTINKWFYLVFVLFRCLKNFNMSALRDFSYEFDLKNQFNLSRRGMQNGGYQLMVQQRFEKNMKEYLVELYNPSLLRIFFSDTLSESIRNGNYDFEVLAEGKVQLTDWALNYAKYQD